MKQTIIFAFILLAALSMVNAIPLHKRETEFFQCPKGSQIEDVTISPDPPESGKNVNFKISGTAEETIPEGSTLFIAFVNLDSTPDAPKFIGEPFSAQVCDGDKFKCPVGQGSTFEKSVDIAAPNNLPTAYVIVVAVTDKDKNIVGCAYTVVGDVKVSPATLVARSYEKFLN